MIIKYNNKQIILSLLFCFLCLNCFATQTLAQNVRPKTLKVSAQVLPVCKISQNNNAKNISTHTSEFVNVQCNNGTKYTVDIKRSHGALNKMNGDIIEYGVIEETLEKTSNAKETHSSELSNDPSEQNKNPNKD